MREVLRDSIGANGWEQQVLFGKNVSPIEQIAQLQHGHISVNQIKAIIDAEHWSDYFKFAVVRNPFDRFVSVCAFYNRQSDDFTRNPQAWMKAAMMRPQFQQRLLVRPQASQLLNQHGKLELDYIGRYELLQDSMNVITDKLNITRTTLPVKNSSKHENYKKYYDESLYRSVAEFYKDDLQLFAYDF
ncbi:MAG: hypothetical protein ACI9FR_001749 [Cryomorphaceae bacterium]|jgi:hypothetical protein